MDRSAKKCEKEEKAEKAKLKFSETRGDVENKIREKPLSSVGIALGVGAMIALLARR